MELDRRREYYDEQLRQHRIKGVLRAAGVDYDPTARDHETGITVTPESLALKLISQQSFGPEFTEHLREAGLEV